MATKDLSSKAQQALGLPEGFKAYTAFPFGGINQHDSPPAIEDSEFVWLENFLHLGAGYLRTAWDKGTPLYTATGGLTIINFFFYNIGPAYYSAVFLSDGSAVQVAYPTGTITQIGPVGTFFSALNPTFIPACSQWGTALLLISNSNTTNDYWIWDGSLLYTAGGASPNLPSVTAPNGTVLTSSGANYSTSPNVTAYGGRGSGIALQAQVVNCELVNVQIVNPGAGYQIGDQVQLGFSDGGSDDGAIIVGNLNPTPLSCVDITSGGSGYTVATVAFSGGGVGGTIASVRVTQQGQYFNPTRPTLTVTGGGGFGAFLVATGHFGGLGNSLFFWTGVSIVNPGFGYTSTPTIVVSGGNPEIVGAAVATIGTGGSQATGTVQILGGMVVGVTITSPGSGYVAAPIVTITGDGTGATANAELVATFITGGAVLVAGSGYTFAPNISFVGGGGAGATGTVQLVGTSIARINLTAGGSGYTTVPTISFNGGGGGSGATATAIIANGAVVAINLTGAGSGYTTNVQVAISGPGVGAGAQAIFVPTSISQIIMASYGFGYTNSPAVQITPGANNSAYGFITLMPYGVSGLAIETFGSRVWIGNPAQPNYVTPPLGGNFAVTAPESLWDFATSDGGLLFTSSASFLQTQYVGIKQSNGYLYFLGDGSVSVVSNVQATPNQATLTVSTTFSYQNTDPQTGLSYRDAMQAFGRSLLVVNNTGVYALYGGQMTKVSQKIDKIFATAVFPPAVGAITPTASIATIFDIKHYLLSMTVIDPDTNLQRNVMVVWNDSDWTIASQTAALTFIGAQKINSDFLAWGTDGNALYPLFSAPSTTLTKRLDTKFYGMDTGIIIKDLVSVWLQGQDLSQSQVGINATIDFIVSGLAIQSPEDMSVESGIYDVLFKQPSFPAPPPFWPVWGAGTGGLPFCTIGARLTTTSPDFALSNLTLGYLPRASIF